MTNIVEIEKTVVVSLNGKRLLPMTVAPTNEGDPDCGTVSCDTPLVKAILGKSEGEAVSYKVGDRVISAKILEVLG